MTRLNGSRQSPSRQYHRHMLAVRARCMDIRGRVQPVAEKRCCLSDHNRARRLTLQRRLNSRRANGGWRDPEKGDPRLIDPLGSIQPNDSYDTGDGEVTMAARDLLYRIARGWLENREDDFLENFIGADGRSQVIDEKIRRGDGALDAIP